MKELSDYSNRLRNIRRDIEAIRQRAVRSGNAELEELAEMTELLAQHVADVKSRMAAKKQREN